MYVCMYASRIRFPARCVMSEVHDTGVCEQHIPCRRAFALRSSSINCFPASDLVSFKLVVPRVVLLWRSVFFHRHRYVSATESMDQSLGHSDAPCTVCTIISTTYVSTIHNICLVSCMLCISLETVVFVPSDMLNCG